jgi:hypothetical protein
VASVLVLTSRKQRARNYICPWIASGAAKVGDKVQKIWAQDYIEPCTDVLVFYGFDGSRDSNISKAFGDYVTDGRKAVYIDVGYFKLKKELGRYRCYHRFSVNARHPDAYFQNIKHPQDRADRCHVRVEKKMRQGSRILLCGMSDKASAFDGAIGWEQAAINEIRKYTNRPIVYRPKPQREKNGQMPPIVGVGYSNPELVPSIQTELQNAWAVVSHHSNAGIDALCMGVPCFQDEGVASVLGLKDLALIENPRLPSYEERRQLMNDVCYAQFNGFECEDGTAWRHLKDDGLIP